MKKILAVLLLLLSIEAYPQTADKWDEYTKVCLSTGIKISVMQMSSNYDDLAVDYTDDW